MNARSHHRGFPVALALLVLGASAQKVPDRQINRTPALANNPAIASSGSAVHVVWEDYRNGGSDIYFDRSLDAGATWLPAELRLNVGSPPGDGHATTHAIAADGDTLVVVWEDDRNEGHDIYCNRSLDGGLTWLPTDVRLDVDGTKVGARSWDPQIAVAGSSVYVVWTEIGTPGFLVEGDIHFNRSLDGGATWLPTPVRLDVGSAPFALDSRRPRIAVAEPAVYVAWDDGSVDRILFNRSFDSGTTWLSEAMRLDRNAEPEVLEPTIAASGSAVYVAWCEATSNYDIHFNRSLDGGTTWLAASVRLDVDSSPGRFFSFDPRIAASGSSVYVAWQESRVGLSDIHFNRSLDWGTTWLSAEMRLHTDPPFSANSNAPQLVAVGSSVHALWQDRRHDPSTYEIYYNRSLDEGTTWLPADARLNTGVAPGTEEARRPRLAASGGSVHATWMDFRNPEGSAFYNLASGHQPYGAGKPGSGGIVPTIAAHGDPAIGGTFELELANGLGGAQGALVYGLDGPASISIVGGTLLVAPPIELEALTLGGVAGVPGAGSATIPVPVPFDPSLMGLRVNMQALVLDAGAANGALSLTGALEIWVL